MREKLLSMIISNFWWGLGHVYSRLNRSLVMGVCILRTVPKRIVELEMKTGTHSRYHSLFTRSIFCDLRKTSDIFGNPPSSA